MIRPEKALGWLNALETSHLDSEAAELSEKLGDASLAEEDYTGARDDLLGCIHKAVDPLAMPEMQLHVAVAELGRGRVNEALAAFHQAEDWYTNNGQEHRAAIAGWLAGTAGWEAGHNDYAFTHWKNARDGFERLRAHFVRWRMGEPAEWYRRSLHEMDVELTKTVEQAYTWLDQLERYPLDARVRSIKEAMEAKVRAEQFASADELLQHLQEASQTAGDILEQPEILAASGLAAYQMHFPVLAEEYLQEAVHRYLPYSHRQGVALWMLGAVQWEITGSYSKAHRHWQRSIDIFERLGVMADQQNNQEYHDWYLGVVPLMQQALQERLAGI